MKNGRKIYFSKYFADKLGYNTFTKISNYNACCNYIIKYITKEPLRNENDQIYFCSKGLLKCQSEIFYKYIDEKYLEGGFEHTFDYINEMGEKKTSLYCKVKDVYIDSYNNNTKIDYILDTTDQKNLL